MTQSRLLPFNNENEEKKKTLDLLFKENMNRQKKRKFKNHVESKKKEESTNERKTGRSGKEWNRYEEYG